MAGNYLMARRTADAPTPAVSSSRMSCSICDADVWVDLGLVPLAQSLDVVCSRCVERRALSELPRPSGEARGANGAAAVDPSEGMATPSQPGDVSASPARATRELVPVDPPDGDSG